jgi:hypothetical protein
MWWPCGPIERLGHALDQVERRFYPCEDPRPAHQALAILQAQQNDQQEPDGKGIDGDQWADQAITYAKRQCQGIKQKVHCQVQEHDQGEPKQHSLLAISQPEQQGEETYDATNGRHDQRETSVL